MRIKVGNLHKLISLFEQNLNILSLIFSINCILLTFVFYRRYADIYRLYNDLFPLGWDPPIYAGYASSIMHGNILRPFNDVFSAPLVPYVITITSLITSQDIKFSEILLIHFLIALYSYLIFSLFNKLFKKTLLAILISSLATFNPTIIRLSVLPGQLMSECLILISLLFTISLLEKRISLWKFLIFSIIIEYIAFLTHWIYPIAILLLTKFLIIAILRKCKISIWIALPTFSSSILGIITTWKYTLFRININYQSYFQVQEVPPAWRVTLKEVLDFFSNIVNANSPILISLNIAGLIIMIGMLLFQIIRQGRLFPSYALICVICLHISSLFLMLFSYLILPLHIFYAYFQRLCIVGLLHLTSWSLLYAIISFSKKVLLHMRFKGREKVLPIKKMLIFFTVILLAYSLCVELIETQKYSEQIFRPWLKPEIYNSLRQINPPSGTIIIIYRPENNYYRTTAYTYNMLMMYGNVYFFYQREILAIGSMDECKNLLSEYEKNLCMSFHMQFTRNKQSITLNSTILITNLTYSDYEKIADKCHIDSWYYLGKLSQIKRCLAE